MLRPEALREHFVDEIVRGVLAQPQEIAFEELRNKSGTQFHPACAEALIRAIEKRNEVHGMGFEEKTHFEDAPEVGLGSAGLGDLLADEKAKK